MREHSLRRPFEAAMLPREEFAPLSNKSEMGPEHQFINSRTPNNETNLVKALV